MFALRAESSHWTRRTRGPERACARVRNTYGTSPDGKETRGRNRHTGEGNAEKRQETWAPTE